MNTATEHQLHLLHHTLGVRPDQRKPYRNHYVAGPGHHSQSDLEQLEAAGLMEHATPPRFLADGDVVFRVTEAGRSYALEHLPPEPKRSKYEQYLHSESSLSFAEWLGIDVPEREYGWWGDAKGKVRLKSRLAVGGWAKTIKEAKASYKAVLRPAAPQLTAQTAQEE